MSSTRYSSDPETFSPERHLASAKITGINIGLNIIGRVARARTPDQRRAMVWLHNSARLRQLTADALGHELGVSHYEIRDALTNPAAEGIDKFCEAVAKVRAEFENNLPRLAKNRIFRKTRDAMREAHEDKIMGLIIGAERIGKSEAFLDTYLREFMDRGIMISCPEGRDMRSFVVGICQALGITVNSAKKNETLREQIMGTFETGVIEILCLDEVQRIWPTDLQRQMPEKIEFLRTLWDKSEMGRRVRRGCDGGGGLAIAGCATPQFSNDLNVALEENTRWKPGQFEGRMRRTYLPDTLTQHEVREIARLVAPDFDDAALDRVTTVTLASAGLLGFLGNIVGRIRYMARTEKRLIDPSLIDEAAREMLRGTITERKAKDAAAKAASRQQGRLLP
jgi:hypothetical protein